MGLLYDYHELLTLNFVMVVRGYVKVKQEGRELIKHLNLLVLN